MMNDYFIALVSVSAMILFALDETTVAVAQQSLLDENVSRINLTQTSLYILRMVSQSRIIHILL
jgi:hypothetical protein